MSNFPITRQTKSESVHNEFLKNDEVLFEYGAGEWERVAKPGDMLLMAPFHDTRFGIVLWLAKRLHADRFAELLTASGTFSIVNLPTIGEKIL